ncbi:hypothetical protein [Streptomyces fradiae]|uniref:hypothetical protein n=1 Tax=Streptomyces fradiae TaxID=1906 RepID=UPI0039861550
MKALLPTGRRRWRSEFVPEAIPGLLLIAANLIGCALAGDMIAAEFDRSRMPAAASVPDQEPYAEEQPQQYAANATAGTTSAPPQLRHDPREEL